MRFLRKICDFSYLIIYIHSRYLLCKRNRKKNKIKCNIFITAFKLLIYKIKQEGKEYLGPPERSDLSVTPYPKRRLPIPNKESLSTTEGSDSNYALRR